MVQDEQYPRLKKPKRKLQMNEIVYLFHSLNIEKKELQVTIHRIKAVKSVKDQLQGLGLETNNIDTLLDYLKRQKTFSVESIQTLSRYIAEVVDTDALAVAVSEIMRMENMNFYALSREIGYPDKELELFLKTGSADDYLILRLLEYFQSND